MAEEEKLLNVDLNYLLIWLIASGLCSNYMLGKTGIKRVNFGPGSNKLMSEECERDGSPIHLQIELIVCFLFLLLLLCCAQCTCTTTRTGVCRLQIWMFT